MPIPTAIDIGTAIITLALPTSAIAYSVTYPNTKKAVVSWRNYTENDAGQGIRPAQVFDKLVSDNPGVWNTTYSNLECLLNLDTVSQKMEFREVVLEYDDKRFCWNIANRSDLDAILRIMAGYDDAPDQALFAPAPKTTTK